MGAECVCRTVVPDMEHVSIHLSGIMRVRNKSVGPDGRILGGSSRTLATVQSPSVSNSLCGSQMHRHCLRSNPEIDLTMYSPFSVQRLVNVVNEVSAAVVKGPDVVAFALFVAPTEAELLRPVAPTNVEFARVDTPAETRLVELVEFDVAVIAWLCV